MSNNTFSHNIKVRGFHLDMYGHVNNARYLEMMEEARWAYFEERMDFGILEKNMWGFVIVNYNINYRYPAKLSDVIEVGVEISRVGGKSMTIHQRLTLAGTDKVVVEADVTAVIMDLRTQRAVQLDKEVLGLMGYEAD